MALLKKADTGTGAAQPTSELLRSVMAQELAEQLSAAEARCAALRVELAEARIVAEPAHRLREMAEAAWELNGERHTVAEVQRLEQRRAEDASAARRVADLEEQLSEAEGELACLKESDERARAHALAQQVWPPTVRGLVKPVRALIPALKAQHAAWEHLAAERATGAVDRDLELAIYGVGFSDDLLPELERWLAVAEHNGYNV
ncbi:MAG TPA: hypothetical protein VGF38_01505 [Ktedonobacterales bacterium]|jgi:hypothetical protein